MPTWLFWTMLPFALIGAAVVAAVARFTIAVLIAWLSWRREQRKIERVVNAMQADMRARDWPDAPLPEAK